VSVFSWGGGGEILSPFGTISKEFKEGQIKEEDAKVNILVPKSFGGIIQTGGGGKSEDVVPRSYSPSEGWPPLKFIGPIYFLLGGGKISLKKESSDRHVSDDIGGGLISLHLVTKHRA